MQESISWLNCWLSRWTEITLRIAMHNWDEWLTKCVWQRDPDFGRRNLSCIQINGNTYRTGAGAASRCMSVMKTMMYNSGSLADYISQCTKIHTQTNQQERFMAMSKLSPMYAKARAIDPNILDDFERINARQLIAVAVRRFSYIESARVATRLLIIFTLNLLSLFCLYFKYYTTIVG